MRPDQCRPPCLSTPSRNLFPQIFLPYYVRNTVSSTRRVQLRPSPLYQRMAVVALSNTYPDLRKSTLSGGGVGAADIARHLLRPQIPLGG